LASFYHFSSLWEWPNLVKFKLFFLKRKLAATARAARVLAARNVCVAAQTIVLAARWPLAKTMYALAARAGRSRC